MVDLFLQGGWVMYLILACSLVTVAVIVERSVRFLVTRENAREVRSGLEARLGAGLELSLPDEPQLGQGRGAFSAMARCFVRHRMDSPERLEEALFNVARRSIQELQQRLGLLGVIANIAPLLGLFGTVLGMIEIFKDFQVTAGTSQVAALSGGIWVALLTTAFGMAVAIPASAAYHLFDGAISRREAALHDFAEELHFLSPGLYSADGQPGSGGRERIG